MDPLSPYLPSRRVAQRYSISLMTLWRWQRSANLEFPTAIQINGRKLWRLQDLEEWERARARSAGNGRAIT